MNKKKTCNLEDLFILITSYKHIEDFFPPSYLKIISSIFERGIKNSISMYQILHYSYFWSL